MKRCIFIRIKFKRNKECLGRTIVAIVEYEKQKILGEIVLAARCEECKFRKKAEEKPRSFIGIIWRLHTLICPGWKAYQRELANQKGK